VTAAVLISMAPSLGSELNALGGACGHVTQQPRDSDTLVRTFSIPSAAASCIVRPHMERIEISRRRVHAAHVLRSARTRTVDCFIAALFTSRDAALEMFHVKRLRFGLACGSPPPGLRPKLRLALWIHGRARHLVMFHVKRTHAARWKLIILRI